MTEPKGDGKPQNDKKPEDVSVGAPAATEEESLIDYVYGEELPKSDAFADQQELKTDFKAWHHPVKQIVRHHQWGALTHRLMRKSRAAGERSVLRYFTLPGPDLMDVRVLASAIEEFNSKIGYFGFDAGGGTTGENEQEQNTYLATEAALRQAEIITDDAVILGGRLEDIAVSGSHADDQLELRQAFDVINIDACEHLGSVPQGRQRSLFDALERLLAHQISAKKPWLLFVTTRVDPAQLGVPADRMRQAIEGNLAVHPAGFGEALCDCIGAKIEDLTSALASCWKNHDLNFLRIYSIGLGKFLLQHFHAQPNYPATVELASAYAYKVFGEQPDMLALAFRIIPKGLTVLPPTAGPQPPSPPIELQKAIRMAKQAKKVVNLDEAIVAEEDTREKAVSQTKELLQSSDYDIRAWKKWLAEHKARSMKVS